MNSFNLHRLAPAAAIVDLDGTLLDTLGDFTAALHGMLDDLGVPTRLSRRQVERHVGKGSEHLVNSVLKMPEVIASIEEFASKNEAIVVRAQARYQAHYARVNGHHAAVYPGAEAGLAGLRARGLRLACVTNKPTAFARQLLADKGLGKYFEAVFGGDAFERKKPDPLPLRKACEALGSAPARTLVIGDSSNDAEAARAAGCPVVLVTYGYNHGQPVRTVDADGFVDSMADLLAGPEDRG